MSNNRAQIKQKVHSKKPKILLENSDLSKWHQKLY